MATTRFAWCDRGGDGKQRFEKRRGSSRFKRVVGKVSSPKSIVAEWRSLLSGNSSMSEVVQCIHSSVVWLIGHHLG